MLEANAVRTHCDLHTSICDWNKKSAISHTLSNKRCAICAHCLYLFYAVYEITQYAYCVAKSAV